MDGRSPVQQPGADSAVIHGVVSESVVEWDEIVGCRCYRVCMQLMCDAPLG
jgi:hypothetical protein